MDPGDIALELMVLFGKLRRVRDAQVRRSLEGHIDALVAEYERARRVDLERGPAPQKERPRQKRERE